MDEYFNSTIRGVVSDNDFDAVKAKLVAESESQVDYSVHTIVYEWCLPMKVKIERFIVEIHGGDKTLLVLEADSKLNIYKNIIPKRRSEYEVSSEIENFLVNCGYRISYEYVTEGIRFKAQNDETDICLYKLNKLNKLHDKESMKMLSGGYYMVDFSRKSDRNSTNEACDFLISLVDKAKQDLPIHTEEIQ